MAKVFAKDFVTALKHLLWPWSSPRAQGSHWELEPLTMAKVFSNVFAMALRHVPWPRTLPRPQGPHQGLHRGQGLHHSLEMLTMAKAFATVPRPVLWPRSVPWP